MKNKIVLTITLLLLMFGCLTAGAAESVFFRNEKNGFTNTNYNYFTLTEKRGLFGKESGQKSTLVEGQYSSNANKGWELFTFTDEAHSYRYLVMETNFVPEAGLKYCVLATGGGAELSVRVTGWHENRWNNIRYIYEFPDEENANGYVTAYLNSECVIERSSVNRAIASNQLRLSFNGKIGESRVAVHTADFKVYATNDAIAAQAYAAPEGLRVFSKRIYTEPHTLTISDVSCEGAAVRVYTDDTFKQTVPSGEYLYEGNVVVYETKDAMYSYYTLHFTKADGTMLVSRTDSSVPDSAVSIKNADTEKAVAVMGRKSDDESMRLALSESCMSGAAEIIYPLGESDYPRYLSFGLSVCPDEGVSISAETERGNTVADRIYTLNSTLVANRWNYVEIVYDTSAYTADTYVNGKCIRQGEETLLGTENLYNSFKIMLHIPDDGAVYVDTIEVSVSEKYPLTEMKKRVNAAYATDGYMCENSLIEEILSADELRVYTDDTFTSLTQKLQLQKTDCVVTEDDEGRIVYYTVIGEDAYRDMLVNNYPPVIVTGDVTSDGKVFSGIIYAVCPIAGRQTLIAAKYKDDILTEVVIGEEVNKMLSVEILPDDDTDAIKVFLWDSLDTMTPGCESLLLTK